MILLWCLLVRDCPRELPRPNPWHKPEERQDAMPRAKTFCPACGLSGAAHVTISDHRSYLPASGRATDVPPGGGAHHSKTVRPEGCACQETQVSHYRHATCNGCPVIRLLVEVRSYRRQSASLLTASFGCRHAGPKIVGTPSIVTPSRRLEPGVARLPKQPVPGVLRRRSACRPLSPPPQDGTPLPERLRLRS